MVSGRAKKEIPPFDIKYLVPADEQLILNRFHRQYGDPDEKEYGNYKAESFEASADRKAVDIQGFPSTSFGTQFFAKTMAVLKELAITPVSAEYIPAKDYSSELTSHITLTEKDFKNLSFILESGQLSKEAMRKRAAETGNIEVEKFAPSAVISPRPHTSEEKVPPKPNHRILTAVEKRKYRRNGHVGNASLDILFPDDSSSNGVLIPNGHVARLNGQRAQPNDIGQSNSEIQPSTLNSDEAGSANHAVTILNGHANGNGHSAISVDDSIKAMQEELNRQTTAQKRARRAGLATDRSIAKRGDEPIGGLGSF